MSKRIDRISNQLHLTGTSGDRMSKYRNYLRTAQGRMNHFFNRNGLVMIHLKQNEKIRWFFHALGIEVVQSRSLVVQLLDLYLTGECVECMPPDYEFMLSSEWRALRRQVFATYGYECMKCKAHECLLHIDHIKPRSKYPELQNDFNNLQVLCAICNIKKSDKEIVDYRPKSSIVSLNERLAKIKEDTRKAV